VTDDLSPAGCFRQSLSLVIGVDAYADGIRPLTNAVRDARAVAKVLHERHELTPDLLVDPCATVPAIRGRLAALAERVTPDDRLLVFAACHGMSVPSDGVRPDGYLLLHDARPGEPSTWLAMRELHRGLAALRCRHLLVVLDCCFAGMFASQRDVDQPLPVYRERYEQFVSSAAWHVLASAASDQRAFDVIDPARGDHSPFAAALLESLAGAADLDTNGLVTTTELYWYVRNHVERRELAVTQRQTPCLYPLDKHEHGEFVFQVAPQIALADAPVLTAERNPYRGLEPYRATDSGMFFGRTAAISELVERASTRPLTIVIGPSGSGKTSLVNAGLVPVIATRAR
jgi:uncharacterized caspase-like protein